MNASYPHNNQLQTKVTSIGVPATVPSIHKTAPLRCNGPLPIMYDPCGRQTTRPPWGLGGSATPIHGSRANCDLSMPIVSVW